MAKAINKIAIIVITMTMLIGMFALSGCTADIDGKYKGLSIGFNYEHPNSLPSIVCAVRSDNTEFDTNDVTLDFYFGWQKETPYIIESSDGYTLGFALYIWNPEIAIKYDDENTPYIDENEMHYLKEIPADEFISENYKVTITKRGGKQFQQKASLTIPKKLFNEIRGEIWFAITSVWYSYDEGVIYNSYNLSKDYIEIRFEYTDENTVRVSK